MWKIRAKRLRRRSHKQVVDENPITRPPYRNCQVLFIVLVLKNYCNLAVIEVKAHSIQPVAHSTFFTNPEFSFQQSFTLPSITRIDFYGSFLLFIQCMFYSLFSTRSINFINGYLYVKVLEKLCGHKP